MGVIDLAYRVYERRLTDDLRGGPLPQHVGVILDGNRRFARERGLADPTDGHAAGARRIDPFLDWCLELDHLRRPQSVRALQKALLGSTPDYRPD
jgi:short-chain Z-isoprenyl diphosphate synthase